MKTVYKKGTGKILLLMMVLSAMITSLVIPNVAFAARTINVSTASQLTSALANAQPGDTIIMAPGTYVGNFKATVNGTSTAIITLKSSTSSDKAILTGYGIGSGYGLQVTGDYWTLRDIKVTNSQKGIVLDNANNCVLHGCTVYGTGMEGFHFRDGSSNNTAQYCKVYDTGNSNAGYGEGFYVGTDYADWSKYNRSCNNNKITSCTLGSDVTAEHIDIKEGTFGTAVTNNTFLGAGISGANSADTFIDVKGRNITISGNNFYKQNNGIITAAISESKRPVDASLTCNGSLSDTSDGNTYTNNTTYTGNP